MLNALQIKACFTKDLYTLTNYLITIKKENFTVMTSEVRLMDTCTFEGNLMLMIEIFGTEVA